MNSSWPLWIIGLYWLWTLFDKEQQRSISRWFWMIVVACGVVGVCLSVLTGTTLPVGPESRPPGY